MATEIQSRPASPGQEAVNEQQQTSSGRVMSAGIIVAAILCLVIVIVDASLYPRTDDAEIFANFIGMAPLVEGPITRLFVSDNQYVKSGDPLYQIDDRPYLYALERAQADQRQLEGQIRNEERSIAAQQSAVRAAQAGTRGAQANAIRADAAIQEANEDVTHAEAMVKQAQAEYKYADDNLHRLEPLLGKQYVTIDQVDRARSEDAARAEAVSQAEAELRVNQARVLAMQAQQQQASAGIEQSHAQVSQSAHAVNLLDPYTAQRGASEAAVERAQYDYGNTRIYAPFDARVTNLTISRGAYAHVGQQIFTLIDTRVWWVIANFRETQLSRVQPGMHVDVYVMSEPSRRLDGIVDSVAYGVTPDADVLGRLSPAGLPDAQRTLNWVHLASRYPVRIRVLHPPPELFRVGESASVVVRGFH